VVNVVVSEADSAEVAVDVAEAGEEVVDAAEDEENKMTKSGSPLRSWAVLSKI
jgi:hypothetical protein